MPTTYAHWNFGQDCYNTMPSKYQEIINKYRNLYDLGVHGPDIFFYDLKNSDVSHYGHMLHTRPAKELFESFKQSYEAHEEKEPMISYLLGFLSHFTLDCYCHSYVFRKTDVSKVSHNKIESEFDSYLMMRDGKDPNKVNRAESLCPDEFSDKIISYFFDKSIKQIEYCTRMQVKVIEFTRCKTKLKRSALKKVLNIMNKSDYADLICDDDEFELCKDSNLRLLKLKDKSLKMFPILMNSLLGYFEGKNELDKEFDHNFEMWPDYKTIPVLSYKDELEYKV